MTANGLDFGNQQSLFLREIEKGKSGCIDLLDMKHLGHENKKYWLLTYIPHYVRRNTQFVFSVRIDDNRNERDENKRSVTRISVDQGASNLMKSEQFNRMDYHQMAGKWLVDSFFGPDRYKYTNASLVLPPQYTTSFGEANYKKIKFLLICVKNDDGIVNWWLSKFSRRIQCINIKSEVKLQINECQQLMEIERVEIEGPCDIDRRFLQKFEGECFYWKDMKTELDDIDMWNACMECMNTNEWKAIYLQQGSVDMRERMLERLMDTYAGGTFEEDTDTFVFKHKGAVFRFRMSMGNTVFGNIQKNKYMNRKNVKDWPIF